MSETTITIPAEDVREGDFLPGLDNGYVIEDPEHDPDFRDGNNMGLAHGMVCITFHDRDGEENYLLVWPSMLVTVRPDDD